jgi:hypothetical protein
MVDRRSPSAQGRRGAGAPFSARFVAGIDANRTLKDTLAAAASAGRGRRRISVTDLINPRQAFFQRTHPEIRPSPDRLQLLLSGTGFHEVLGRAVSTEEFVEQFVEFQGVVGKIDIYEDTPTELKTTGSLPSDVLAERGSYVDQLGMYCTMTGVRHGRLVVYRRAAYGRPPALAAFDVAYRDLEAIAREMARRRDMLRHALEMRDPAGLPRCEWLARGCDYSELCGCADAAPAARIVPAAAVRLAENPDLARELGAQLARGGRPPVGFRLNDLVFPRKAAYEHRPADPGEDEEDEAQDAGIEARLADLQRQGFWGALNEALRFGVPGAFARELVVLGSLKGWVATFQGIPTLLRSNRWPEMADRRELAERFPHYFDRLAFECALTRSERGRIIVYYEAIAGDKFMVYDVWWRDLAAIRAEAERRLALLEAGAPPGELPPCPPWMAKFCKFAPGCGCGG